jgi:carbon storage regulator CsrA
MLVLTRKADQKIQIGPDITITVLEVRGRYVRVGIEAPPEVRVLRSELSRMPPTGAPIESHLPVDTKADVR